MLRARDIPIGLITEGSTAHEAKRDSRQEAKSAISAPESKTQLVLAARPEPSFHRYLDLSPALLALVAIFWDQKDLHQFNRALVGFYNHYFRTFPLVVSGDGAAVVTYQPMGAFLHRQFKVVPRQARLLQAVIAADYSQAQAAVDQDLSLMFKSVNFKYRDGSSECISPLKYAFKVYDTYMWKLFYEKIKANPEQVKAFLKQAQEQTKHIDLEPLFAAYEEYKKQCQLWDDCELETGVRQTTYEEMEAAWDKLGAAQRLILPVHMLKEFSRKGRTWRACSAFDVTAMSPPSNCQIHDYRTFDWMALSSIISDPGWGSSFWDESFTLVRRRYDGSEWAVAMSLRWELGVGDAVDTASIRDLATFRRLFKVREEDLVKQISLLLQNSHTSPELQTQHFDLASKKRKRN